MPINLDRAEKIGGDYKPSSPNDLKFGFIEVLNVNKIPFNGVSFLRDGFHQCPYCKKSAIKQMIDYRCHRCNSRVIHWKCYVDETEDKHQMYDSYISRFEETTEVMMEKLRKKKEKDNERNLSQ